MVKILVIQLLVALVPGLVGLAVLARTSPRLYRLATKSLQFDMLTALLATAFVAVLLGLNRALVNEQVIAVARQTFLDQFLDLFVWHKEEAAPLFAIYLFSIFAMPTVIFARMIIDAAGEMVEERRMRAEQRNASKTDVQQLNQRE